MLLNQKLSEEKVLKIKEALEDLEKIEKIKWDINHYVI
jgi:hypothetical protein